MSLFWTGVLTLVIGGCAGFTAGFLVAAYAYRIGARDAMLGFPRPQELVRDIAQHLRQGGAIHEPQMYKVEDDEMFGSHN